MTGVRLAAALFGVVLLTSCAAPATRPTAAGASAAASPSAAAPSPSPSPSPSVDTEAFVGEISTVTAADLPHTWRAGCPVAPDALRRLRLSYRDFDGNRQLGTMIVNQSVATDVVSVFRELYRQRFPIRLMQPVDAYAGSDDASMAADNTSGFNCRNAVSTGRPHWSAHAYGLAIDVNPVENPYLLGGRVLPPAGAPYVRRTPYRPGMAAPGGVLVTAFANVGWSWGGRWSSPDYQHMTKTGG